MATSTISMAANDGRHARRRYAHIRDERIVVAAFDVVSLLGARAAAARQTQLLLVSRNS